jgi:hypothetical protein
MSNLIERSKLNYHNLSDLYYYILSKILLKLPLTQRIFEIVSDYPTKSLRDLPPLNILFFCRHLIFHTIKNIFFPILTVINLGMVDMAFCLVLPLFSRTCVMFCECINFYSHLQSIQTRFLHLHNVVKAEDEVSGEKI